MLKNIVLNGKTNIEKSKSLEKIYALEEYKQNQMQIDCISKTLIEHADVPKELIDWLIKAVKENTKLECQK